MFNQGEIHELSDADLDQQIEALEEVQKDIRNRLCEMRLHVLFRRQARVERLRRTIREAEVELESIV